MFPLLFIKNNSTAKLAVNLLNASRTFSQKYVIRRSSLLSSALVKKPRVYCTETQLWRSYIIKRHNQGQYWGKNTNVANNVILYKIEGFRFLKIAHIYGICAIVLWIAQIWYLYKDNFFSNIWTIAPEKFIEDNIKDVSLLVFSTCLGPCFYIMLYALSTRLIKCVILNKGGKHVSFITFNPLKSRRIITVPVDQVYCLQPRNYPGGGYTSVKIDNRRFNFLIDKGGTYVNPELFDHTVVWHK